MAEHKVAHVRSEMIALRTQFFSEFSATVAHETKFFAQYVADVEQSLSRCVTLLHVSAPER